MAFPTWQEVVERVEFDLADIGDDATTVIRFIESNLNDLIIEACSLGRDDWTHVTMPEIVSVQIRSAMVRFLRRPEGYVQSRAGDETLTWADADGHSGIPAFTETEIDVIQQSATPGRAKVGTMATSLFHRAEQPVIPWKRLL